MTVNLRRRALRCLPGGLALLLAACSAVPASQIPAPAPAPASGAAQADAVLQWWQGDFHNDAQIEALRADGAPIWREAEEGESQTFGGHLPVRSFYRTVDLPAFGDRVLYLEELTFGDNPYRQRIYTVTVDDEDRARVKLWYFKDKARYAGAWQDLAQLADLTPEDMSPLPDNCDLVVEPQADGRLQMMMPRDQCAFGSRMFDYRVSLSADDFWFRDRIVNADTKIVLMTAGSFTWHRMDRVR